jgi:hypothetical protein
MKNVVRLGVLLVAVGCFAAVLSYSNKTHVVLTTGPEAEALMRVERELGDALNRLDVKTIEHILADEASITGVRGGRSTKAEMIAEVKSPAASVLGHAVTLHYEQTQPRI